MTITEIWRYPVKSMAGERLLRADFGPMGIAGDRVVHVEDARGRVVTSRTHPRLLSHKGSTGEDGGVMIDGRRWDGPVASTDVIAIAGSGARLVRDDSADRFDVLPLLVATDGAIAAFGHDSRRLRPNLVIGGVPGMAEREWSGKVLRAASGAIIGVQDLRARCIMTSFDPDTQIQDKDITHGIYQRFEGKLALNCFAIAGGTIAVGDEVTLEDAR